MKFGEKVRRKRTNLGWTVEKFIQELDVKVSPSYINKIEMKCEIPSCNLVHKISKTLKIPLLDLLESAKKEKLEHLKLILDEKYRVKKP